jgi:protein involved in polysaccharide export with SLBB domain
MTKNDMTKQISGKAAAFLFALALLLLSGCVSTGTRTVEVPDRTSDYVLGVGDNLRISVYGEEALTGEFKVNAKGAVSLPLINDVQAAGATAAWRC